MLSKIIKKINKSTKAALCSNGYIQIQMHGCFLAEHRSDQLQLHNFKWTLNFMSIWYEKKDQGVFFPLTS